MNFAALVGAIGRRLEDWVAHPFKTTWDGDTLVLFDQPGTRVLLGWTPAPVPGVAGVLTLSVGPSSMLGRPVLRPDAKSLCERLVQELSGPITPDEVLWHQIACHMTEDWVDLLIDALPVTRLADLRAKSAAAASAEPVAPPPIRESDAEHAHIRAAFTAPQDPPTPALSAQMRLAIHAMNATLIMVWGPLGAAALAHGVIRGENLRMSAHLMVLSGLASAVLHSPKGQSLLALAPVL